MTRAEDVVTDHDQLTAILGAPSDAARDKVRTRLHDLDRAWLAASPFCLVATADSYGRCDVSPKGDPPGSIVVVDDTTIALPERAGNRRADGFHNILDNPHVGLIVVLPGRVDTLRVNGRARILRDTPYADAMVVRGHRPALVLEIAIDEVFHHCGKAFLRSALWDATTWRPDAVPSRAHIARTLERPGESLEDLERHYGPTYEAGLYPPG